MGMGEMITHYQGPSSGGGSSTPSGLVLPAPVPSGGMPVNAYQALPGHSASSIATAVPGTSRTIFCPFHVERDTILDRFGIEVTGAATAGTQYRIGIYASTTDDWQPSAVMLDSVQNVDSIGFKWVSPGLELPTGRYLAALRSLSPVTQATLRVWTSNYPMAWVDTSLRSLFMRSPEAALDPFAATDRWSTYSLNGAMGSNNPFQCRVSTAP